MVPGVTLVLLLVALVAVPVLVLHRRQWRSGADLWVAGQERRPRVGEVVNTNPHSNGGASGTAGLGGGDGFGY